MRSRRVFPRFATSLTAATSARLYRLPNGKVYLPGGKRPGRVYIRGVTGTAVAGQPARLVARCGASVINCCWDALKDAMRQDITNEFDVSSSTLS